jgi:hypothetical protein
MIFIAYSSAGIAYRDRILNLPQDSHVKYFHHALDCHFPFFRLRTNTAYDRWWKDENL